MTPLKRARLERNMTQVALSLATGIPQGTICRLEREENRSGVTWKLVRRLATALAADPFELFPELPADIEPSTKATS